jgi:hypothetical protein
MFQILSHVGTDLYYKIYPHQPPPPPPPPPSPIIPSRDVIEKREMDEKSLPMFIERFLACFQDCVDGKCGVLDARDRKDNGKNFALQLKYMDLTDSELTPEKKERLIDYIASKQRGCFHIIQWLDFDSPSTTDFHFYLSRDGFGPVFFNSSIGCYGAIVLGVETMESNQSTTLMSKDKIIRTWNFSSPGIHWLLNDYFIIDIKEDKELHFTPEGIKFITVWLHIEIVKKIKEYIKEWYELVAEEDKDFRCKLLEEYDIIPPLVNIIMEFAYF